MAYHDTDSVNNGSGRLNPADGSFLNEFRRKEGVDISYTKGNNVDNNPYNKAVRELNQLYVGWTVPGEWIRYYVSVKEDGVYRIGLLYTANGKGAISFDIDGIPIATQWSIPSTHNDLDTTAWRQWHHWNRIDSLTEIRLSQGSHQLTAHMVENGNMNFDYWEFIKN